MDLGFELSGDTTLALKFDALPRDVHARILARLTSLEPALEEAVRAGEPHRTGRLSSLTSGTVTDEADRVTLRVAMRGDFAKAGVFEFGAPGPRSPRRVKAHAMRLDHVFGRLVAPMMVTVAAHAHPTHIAARHMFERALAGMHDEIVAELRQAVQDAASSV